MSYPVVVTGVASGIGAAVAEALRAAGTPVIGVDRSAPSSANEAFVQADLSTPEGVAAAVVAVEERSPEGLSGLVNVAGVPGTAPWPTVVAVNVLALRDLTDRLVPRIHEGGAVVHLASSVAADWAARAASVRRVALTTDWEAAGEQVAADPELLENVYRFSKECVRFLTEHQAAANVVRGVRVVSVSPGPIQTPILEDFKNDHGRAKVESAAEALGRFGDPEEVAGAIAFLLRPEARWVNGTDLRVDGGLAAVRAVAANEASSVR